MTHTLTTERLREIASGPSFSANPLSHEVKYMARELLANREAQPVIVVGDDGGDALAYRRLIQSFSRGTKLYTAPPAPAVPAETDLHGARMAVGFNRYIQSGYVDGWNACRAAMLAQPVSLRYKLPPHAYRELVNVLRDTAVKYSGTDQLRERLNTALSKFIEPDHPHTRAVEQEGDDA